MSGIKSMAPLPPLFVAFDHPHYQKLIARCDECGAFVCSVSGKHIALDEALVRGTIVCPSKEYLDGMLYYYPVQSMVH